METSSGADFNQQMLPPRQQCRPSGPGSNSDTGKKADKDKEGESECPPEPQVIRRVSASDRLSLRKVACERVDVISDRMAVMPDELLEELKGELRLILEGTVPGGAQHREEFLNLQKLVRLRTELTAKTLVRAHRVQLEILVAINTGIQAFLHPNISLPQSRLIEVFLYKRCRNIACQNVLPADDCNCEICSSNKNGFCNLCMCIICNKFDFEVNTCRWIGCDMCSHWIHTDCAIRSGLIGTVKSGAGHAEMMLFRCQACNRASELRGWVKDVFQQCALVWDRETLMRELEFVSRIFRMSEDPEGRKLCWKCGDLIEKLKSGTSESMACRMLLLFFQELDIDSAKNHGTEEAGRLLAPHEACNQIVEAVQEAVRKMEMVAEEKMCILRRACLSVEACDRELADKGREVAELKMERQRKKQQVEDLDSIMKLKQAEAEMFQLKATEAWQEADRIQSIALAKSEKAEQDYATMYLKRRLDEAEAEKQYLFEKIKLQESQRAHQGSSSGGGDPSQMLMVSKIQDLLKNMYNVPPKSEGQ